MNSGGLSTPSNDPEERLAYIALALIPGLGARTLVDLLSAFGSARAVLSAPPEAVAHAAGLRRGILAGMRNPPIKDAQLLIEYAAKLGQQVLAPSDSEYPSALRSIPDPPVTLFAVGRLEALQRPAVAIVGSRDHTRYGAQVAHDVARTAAEAGLLVVSGMARGLDAVAQTAALDAGGLSVGVLGTGADVTYPAENHELFERMRHDGLLLTEHPPGDRSNRWAFPRRNRLISGLARVLIVVEAAEGSGTLTTVSSALEQGREVLVVPGPINSPTSKGTNRLIRDGATPLLTPDDLLASFGVESSAVNPMPVSPRCDLSPNEAQVLSALSALPRSVDEVALTVGLPIGLVLGTLLGLELGGLIEQLSDSSYRRR